MPLLSPKRRVSDVENKLRVLFCLKTLGLVTQEQLWPFVARMELMDYLPFCLLLDELKSDGAVAEGNGAMAGTLYLTPEELYNRVKQDRLYFLATGGGVTFGGGEPLLYPGFIAEFRGICGGEWKICAETSLAVPAENVKRAAGVIDRFFVDCKDTDPVIYKSYTGKSSDTMTENLKMLVSLVSPDRITARLPLIPGFNSESDVDASEKFLLSLGITDIDRFTYTVKQ